MATAGAPNIAPAGTSSNPILDYVQNNDNDILGNNLTLRSLEVDATGAQTAVQPATLRDEFTQEFLNSIMNGLGMLDDQGRLSIFFAPTTVTLSVIGLRNHPDEGKFIGFLGDLLNGVHFDYFIKTQNPCPFQPIANTILCLAADDIHAQALQHNGQVRFTVGPHQAGDAGVTLTHSRKIFKIPFTLLQQFMAIPDDADVTLYFWVTIFPLIQAENMETEMKSLIDYFRVAATLDTAASTSSLVWNNAAAMPTPIGRNADVIERRTSQLKRSFPTIFVDRAAASQVQQMGAMAAAQDRHNAVAQEQLNFMKNQKAAEKLSKILKVTQGAPQLDLICRMLLKANLQDLPKLWRDLFDAKDTTARDEILNRALRETAFQERLEVPHIMPGTADKLLQAYWHMVSSDEPETGSACNPFQWCPAKRMAKDAQDTAKIYSKGNIKVTAEEQKALEKSTLFFCHLDHMENLIRHGYLLWLTLTGGDKAHPVVKFLSEYRGKIGGNRDRIERFPLRDSSDRDIIGVLIQIKLAKELEGWSRAQVMKEPAPILNGDLIIDVVTDQSGNSNGWEPWTSTLGTIKADYGESLKVFRSAGRRPATWGLQDDLTVVGTLTDNVSRFGMVSAVGGNQTWQDDVSHIPEEIAPRAPAMPRARAPRAPAPAPAPPSRERTRTTEVINWATDADLGRTWKNSSAQCGAVKQAAKRGEHEVPPLPKSSVAGHTSDPMCLNWSVLHKCNAECNEAYDHVEQSAEKKEELKKWVLEHASKVPARQRRRRRGGNQAANE